MNTLVKLSKGGTKVNLAKPDGTPLKQIQMGLGWDPVKSGGFLGGIFGGGSKDKAIDLDASCIVLDADKREIDTVWFRKKISDCKSIRHNGDNLTGDGEGDDETIDIDLTKLPQRAKYLILTVNSFRNQRFSEVENASCSVYDMQDGRKTKLAYMNISEKGNHTGMVMVAIERVDGGWKVNPLGQASAGNVVSDMIRIVQASL